LNEMLAAIGDVEIQLRIFFLEQHCSLIGTGRRRLRYSEPSVRRLEQIYPHTPSDHFELAFCSMIVIYRKTLHITIRHLPHFNTLTISSCHG
jgi:hypothetical protein